jgi:hypothetical protein
VNEEEGITEGKEAANRKGRGKATILVKDLLFSHPSDGPGHRFCGMEGRGGDF